MDQNERVFTGLKAGNPTEERILDYLKKNASEVLTAKINAGTKTLAGALNYAKDEARKLKHEGDCVCVPDETVFGWIIHFFEEEELKEKATKTTVRVPGGVKVNPTAVPERKPTAPAGKVPPPKTSMFEAIFGGSKG